MDVNTKQDKATTAVLVKSGFWYTLSNFISRAMVFITTPLFSRLLAPDEMGDFSVFASSQAILLIICGLENYSTINRARFDYQGKGELDGYITSSLALSTVFTALVFVIFLVFPNLYFRFFLLDKKYMYLMFAYLFASPALWMFQAKQRIEYRYKLSAAITFSLVILSSGLAVALAIILKNDRLFGRVFGQYVLNVLVGLFFLIYFVKKSRDIRLPYVKYALRLGLPLVFSYLGAQLLLSTGVFVAKHLSTGESVGFLYIAMSCAQIVLIFVQTLNTAWAPWFFDKLRINETKTIRNIFRIYMWLIVFCTFGVLLIGPEIVAVMGDSQYSESLMLLPPLMLCGVLTALTSQFSNLETYHKKPQYAAILTAIVAAFNLVLAIVGVKLWNYRAVCYSMVISNILLIILHYLVTRKMNIRELLPIKDLIPVIVVSLSFIPLSFLVYRHLTLRLILLALCVVFALAIGLVKRREIVMMLKDFKSKKK